MTLYSRLYESSLRCAQGRKAESVLRSQAASDFGRKHQPFREGQRDFERDEFIRSKLERNKGSETALTQVSRPSVRHKLPIVSFNTDPDTRFEQVSGRNPILGAALIVAE